MKINKIEWCSNIAALSKLPEGTQLLVDAYCDNSNEYSDLYYAYIRVERNTLIIHGKGGSDVLPHAIKRYAVLQTESTEPQAAADTDGTALTAELLKELYNPLFDLSITDLHCLIKSEGVTKAATDAVRKELERRQAGINDYFK